MLDKTKYVFFELLRAGLWERDVRLLDYEGIDYNEVLRLAQDQAVVGLVTAGLERVSGESIPKEIVLQFVGQSLQLEQRNLAMNHFIGVLEEKMNKAGVISMLVKGQGVAQCYQKPQWRASGDVDFLFDKGNYQKAVDLFLPLSTSNKPEGQYSKHLGISIDEWYVELHIRFSYEGLFGEQVARYMEHCESVSQASIYLSSQHSVECEFIED